MFLSLTFPMIDPVLISVGPFAIRWYALSYIAGIFLGITYLQYLNKRTTPVFTPKALDDLLLYVVIGIMLGGRLGYVLFYNFGYYSTHPLEIVQLWHGGMSFHGGFLGVVLAVYLLCRKHQLPALKVADLIACVAPIGLMFGRIANFINGELYGRVTDVPWGVVFPNGGLLPRHPSQLYESALEGLVLFLLLSFLVLCTRARQKQGLLLGIFLVGYAVARMAVENFREPDQQIGFLMGSLTMGQLLSIPMLIIGSIFILSAFCKKSCTPS